MRINRDNAGSAQADSRLTRENLARRTQVSYSRDSLLAGHIEHLSTCQTHGKDFGLIMAVSII